MQLTKQHYGVDFERFLNILLPKKTLCMRVGIRNWGRPSRPNKYFASTSNWGVTGGTGTVFMKSSCFPKFNEEIGSLQIGWRSRHLPTTLTFTFSLSFLSTYKCPSFPPQFSNFLVVEWTPLGIAVPTVHARLCRHWQTYCSHAYSTHTNFLIWLVPTSILQDADSIRKISKQCDVRWCWRICSSYCVVALLVIVVALLQGDARFDREYVQQRPRTV